MNTQQARVIDPILTDMARGYVHPERVGRVLFPQIDVPVRGGQIIEFGKESFRLYSAKRAPGASTMSVGFGYAGKPYLLEQEALNAPVPRELMDDARSVPGIDLGKRAVAIVMQSLTLSLEAQQAALATNADNFDTGHKLALSGADQWSDPTSDPCRAVEDAKEVVRRASGVEPNRMVISKPIFNALKFHPKIVERFKYTTAESVTSKMIANLFDLEEVAIGKAVALSSPAENAPFEDVWGNSAVLAYVPQEPKGVEEPSFGYTYTLKSHPFVENAEWDNDIKSWVYGVTYERKPVLAGVSAGFLFQTVVAPKP